MSKEKVLAICINGVIRDFFEQFDNVYRKKFIKNPGLVNMSEGFEFVPDEEDGDEFKRLESKINSLIHLPITTYSLRNHYEFESNEKLDNFLYNESPIELFGTAPQFPFAMETANKINNSKKELGLSSVILFCPGKNQAITATFHFLTRSGCKLNNIIFSENQEDIWNHCDIAITDDPNIINSKPKDKIVVKVEKEYNSNLESDATISNLKSLEFKMFENLIKNNKYE